MKKLLVLCLFAGACAPMKFDYSAHQAADSTVPGDAPTVPGDGVESTPTPPSEGYVSKTENSALNRLGDRTYVASVLESVFGAAPTLATLITPRTEAFGGPCDPWTLEDCFPTAVTTTRLVRSQIASVPTNLASRESWRIRACTTLLQADSYVRTAVARSLRVELSTLPAVLPFPDDDDFLAAYALFYPGREAPPGLIEGMRRVAAEAGALSPGQASLEAWRFVLLGLCESPYWQLL